MFPAFIRRTPTRGRDTSADRGHRRQHAPPPASHGASWPRKRPGGPMGDLCFRSSRPGFTRGAGVGWSIAPPAALNAADAPAWHGHPCPRDRAARSALERRRPRRRLFQCPVPFRLSILTRRLFRPGSRNTGLLIEPLIQRIAKPHLPARGDPDWLRRPPGPDLGTQRPCREADILSRQLLTQTPWPAG